jgi:hypothetical protein
MYATSTQLHFEKRDRSTGHSMDQKRKLQLIICKHAHNTPNRFHPRERPPVGCLPRSSHWPKWPCRPPAGQPPTALRSSVSHPLPFICRLASRRPPPVSLQLPSAGRPPAALRHPASRVCATAVLPRVRHSIPPQHASPLVSRSRHRWPPVPAPPPSRTTSSFSGHRPPTGGHQGGEGSKEGS